MTRRVAVMDDDESFLDLVRELLSDEGYAVETFRGGASDYPRVRALAPDAIVLDVRMEGQVIGWTLFDRMREDPVLRATPVIVASADSPGLEEHRADVERRGGAILVKPFDLDDLLTLLARATGGAGGAGDGPPAPGRP